VKRWGESEGYRVTIEEPTPGGKGSVDVALRRDDFSIACEISVTSTVDQEVGNVLKCLEAGFHEVAVLALKRPHLARIEAALKKKLARNSRGCISSRRRNSSPCFPCGRRPERPWSADTR